MALKRPLKTPATPSFDIAGYVDRFTTWATTKTLADKGKAIHEKMNKDDLKPLILKHGQKDPETGSYTLEFPEPVDAGMYGLVDGVVAQATNPRSLNEERTVAFLQEHSTPEVDLLAEAQETITVLSEDRVIALHLTGKITEADLDALYDTKTTYSFIPRKVRP